jgi:hypothetical protein
MNFFRTPPGYKPADSLTLSLATAAGVFMIYGSKIGPVADVHATTAGDQPINASIKKAGWEAMLLVAGMTLLSRDLNTAILGGSAIILEHVMYLHADMASPASGRIQASPQAYQAAGGPPQLAAVPG